VKKLLATKQQQLSRESRVFAQKVARSIIEVQPNINNTADILVLLECLGYRKETLMKYGFEDYHALVNYVYDFLDAYEMRDKNKETYVWSFIMEIPSIKKRILEGVGLIFPWLGSLALLFITGVSLWMAWGLPIKITTAFVIGVFLGLGITEGVLQVFNRLFAFYNSQTNMGEIKRLLKRSYCLICIILSVTVSILFVLGSTEKIPLNLVVITIISTVTVSLHRASYMIIYALKKLGQLIIAYSAAFASLLLTYYLGQSLITDGTTRYFVGLVIAFFVLSIFAIYPHYKLTKNTTTIVTGEKPHFYNPISRTDKTIKSRFNVQIWEAMPYIIYGTSYFVTLFADRILSWIYNPMAASAGFGLPMAFNWVYHAGADMALVVLLPASIVQYVMMGPIFMHINNISIKIKVSQVNSITKFIQSMYYKLLLATIMASVPTAAILNLLVPVIMSHMGLSQISLHVLQIASVANVSLSIFTANGLFLMLINKVKPLAIISTISALIVILGGIVLANSGFQNLVIAYLAATIFAATASMIYANKAMKHATSLMFARFT
jgi:hypothetical protein